MKTVNSAHFTTISASGNRFGTLQCSDVAFASVSQVDTPMPFAGSILGLQVTIDTPIGAGQTHTFTVTKNGVDTALTVSIAGASQVTASDLVHKISFSALDTLGLHKNSSAATATGDIRITTIISAGIQKGYVCTELASAISPSINTYLGLQGGNTSTVAGVNVEQPMPTTGAFKNFYINISNAPGTGKSYTYTLYQNGSPTSVVLTFSNAATSASDTTNTVTVAVGDLLYWQAVPTGTPTAHLPKIGIQWVPDIDGESLQLCGVSGTLGTTTEFNHVNGTPQNWNLGTEPPAQTIAPVCDWKKLYAKLYTAPGGAGKARTLALVKNGTVSALAATVTDPATTGQDITNTVTTAQGDTVSVKATSANTPTNSRVSYSMVTYILPVAQNTNKMFLVN